VIVFVVRQAGIKIRDSKSRLGHHQFTWLNELTSVFIISLQAESETQSAPHLPRVKARQ